MSPATRGSQNQEVPFSQESQRRCFLRRSRSFLVKLLNLSIHMHAAAPKNGIHLFCQCPRCPGGRADRMCLGPAPGRRHISADFGERRPLRSSRLAGALLGLWRRSLGGGGVNSVARSWQRRCQHISRVMLSVTTTMTAVVLLNSLVWHASLQLDSGQLNVNIRRQ